MSYPAILDTIDQRAAALWSQLAAAQQAAYLANAQYVQGLPLLKETPADGALATPDNLDAYPTDRVGQSWRAVAQGAGLTLPAQIMSNVRIDVYDGPKGKGFVCVLSHIVNGVLWERHINVGAEKWRERNWFAIEESEE